MKYNKNQETNKCLEILLRDSSQHLHICRSMYKYISMYMYRASYLESYLSINNNLDATVNFYEHLLIF